MTKTQLFVILMVAIGYVHTTDTIEILKQIWKYKQAFKTCSSTLNYGCRCSAASVEDLTCDFKCVSLDRRCDGKLDCPLGDDETDCPPARCEKGSICCLNGSCASLCDGVPECPHNADEAQCEPPVPTQCHGRMQCPNGNCATVCDGDLDCDDDVGCDLDEHNCRYKCPSNRYVCEDDGTCSTVCDRNSDCTSGADESVCYFECEPDEISCELLGGTRRGCVELCETSEGACEARPTMDGWDIDDVYCGQCITCGEASADCLKRSEGCP